MWVIFGRTVREAGPYKSIFDRAAQLSGFFCRRPMI